MPAFRKKPIVIQAERVRELIHFAAHDWEALPDWFLAAYEDGRIVIDLLGITVPTLEGDMRAGYDDWLIRGAIGELYPCRADVFDQTYEAL